MSHLSDQFLQQFLEDINKDTGIPSDVKEDIKQLYSTKKIAKGKNLENLLNNLEIKNENSKN